MSLPKVRAAACHFAPIIFEATRSCDKAIGLIHQAARSGANLVVFPESAIPGFPVWAALLPPTRTHDLFQRFAQSSLYVDSEEISAIRHAAAKDKVIVSLGFSEKVRYSTATLFNSNILIGEHGELLNHHRKLMPTFFEKLSWAPGDGYGLRIAETRFGKIGGLICGENTNPLARYALMAQGEQIHISTWPAVWPTRDFDDYDRSGVDHKSNSELANENSQFQDGLIHDAEKPPERISKARPTEKIADQFIPQPDKKPQASWGSDKAFASSNYNNIAANRTRAAAHCFEAKCFGVSCAGPLPISTIDKISEMVDGEHGLKLSSALTRSPRAPTQFFDPTGTLLPGFVDSTGEVTDSLIDKEGILYADLDLNQCVEGKQYHDVVGGYQRFDVFSLTVNRQRYEPAVFVDGNLQAAHSRGDAQKGHPPEANLGSTKVEIGENSRRTEYS
ncbi:uncharacterized protein A1O9_05924 [Exophiala aquamarina CBS 119918]|uniref:CN hydrolase domain-containing protein n=1 Tax=Exophiala aquamarina CBS 119918 TaxID=1182545 RepID=A0A072PDQ9_9EURO|nr:uncharacterized protein A1O9_05924 [Exophiala aquamarina CBS 119918]KEF58001.1 hypothetical protein A1O9_05924 [Exophiala aquamarina CBS 119918]